MQKIPESLAEWMKVFSKAVRDRDFATGRKLFAGDVTAFGTVYFRVDDLDELVSGQWQMVWPRTADFDFNYDSARTVMTSELATVMAEWKSITLDGAQKSLLRHGRVTIVLQKSDNAWKAVHTHFSINPHSTHDPVLRHAGSR
ncbi:MAG: nuclear transport factor 2 family protein [Limisphaerales bacterium]